LRFPFILTLRSRVFHSRTFCRWADQTESCRANPPPQSLNSFVALAITIAFLSIVPKIILISLASGICSGRPTFPYWLLSLFDPRTAPLRRETVAVSQLGRYLFEAELVDEAADPLGFLRYYDSGSESEEIDFILRSVRGTLKDCLAAAGVPWRISADASMPSARAETVLKLLRLDLDGIPSPLSWIWCGHGEAYIKKKIVSARRDQRRIVDQIGELATDEEDSKDSLLMQHFVLEQFPPLERLALKKELFQLDMCDPPQVNGFVWLCGWTLLLSLLLSMVVWTLLWAADSGDAIFRSWVGQFFYCIVQEVLVSQVVTVGVHAFLVNRMRPQLRHISHALNTMTLGVLSSLPMDCQRGIRAVQHISGACRAARDESLRLLPAAMVLQRISDEDIDTLRRKRTPKLSNLATLSLWFLAVFGFGGEQPQAAFFDFLVACSWGAFLLANEIIFSLSRYSILVGYPALAVLAAVYFWLYRPTKFGKSLESETRGGKGRGWKSAQRRALNVSLRNLPSPSAPQNSQRTVAQWKNMNRKM
jgi:hypothetical protein